MEVRSPENGDLLHAVPLSDVQQIQVRDATESADLIVQDRAGTVFEVTLGRREAHQARALISELFADALQGETGP